MTGQPSPVQGILALLDPLLPRRARHSALSVHRQHRRLVREQGAWAAARVHRHSGDWQRHHLERGTSVHKEVADSVSIDLP